MRNVVVFAVVIACLLLPASARADIQSFAIVQDDASLVVRGKTIRLHGIYIPETDQFCSPTLRPARCATRAALALDFIIQGFVRCKEVRKYRDRSISAYCSVERSATEGRQDLGAYLVREGWALASPGAPFEYQALERIARERGFGVWGFQADSIR